MVTEDDVRQVCLSLPGTVEKPYNRLPSFRVRGTLFLRFHELPDVVFVRCGDLEERNELLKAEPSKFFITAYYEGYPGMLVRLSHVDLDEMAELVIESWRLCAPKRILASYDAEHPARVVTAQPGRGPAALNFKRARTAADADLGTGCAAACGGRRTRFGHCLRLVTSLASAPDGMPVASTAVGSGALADGAHDGVGDGNG